MTVIEDPVARAQIAAHIKTCETHDGEFRAALKRIEFGQDNLWKAITRGRETRFRMVMSVVGFMALILLGLIAYIWTTSLSGAISGAM